MSAARPVTYNPEAVYKVPASGITVKGLTDADTGKIQGEMWLPPGTLVLTDDKEIAP